MSSALPPGFVLQPQPGAAPPPPAPGQLPPGYQLVQPSVPSIGADIAKSGGSGLAEGLIGATVALPGDAWNLGKNIGNWIGNKGRDIVNAPELPPQDPIGLGKVMDVLPTTPRVVGAIKDATGLNLDYQPQTEAGTLTKAGASFIPAVLTGGAGELKDALEQGGSAASKVAAAMIAKRAIAPGVASEGAGQVAGMIDPSLEAPVKVATALLTGAKVGGPKEEPGLTSEDLHDMAQAKYKQASDIGAVIEPEHFDAAVPEIRSAVADRAGDLTSLGKLTPKAVGSLDMLDAQRGMAPTLDTMGNIRSYARRIARTNPDDNERRVAGIVDDEIGKYLDGLQPENMISGDPAQALALKAEGDQLWKRSKQAAIAENLLNRADIKTSALTQSGKENALVQQFRALALNPQKMRQLSPDQQEAILSVAKPEGLQKVARYVGKLAVRGPVSGAVALATGGLTMPIGEAAHHIAHAIAERNADRALRVMSGEAPTAGPGLPQRLGRLANFGNAPSVLRPMWYSDSPAQ